MTDVQAALDAMAAAEQEARDVLRGYHDGDTPLGRWARDRLRLVERDRGTITRHKQLCPNCVGSAFLPERWCADARAVIDYWTRERG